MLQTDPAQSKLWLRLREVENAFLQVAIDVKEILVLDGVDQADHPRRFRIRCHDLHGPLPDAVVEDTGERYPVLEHITREAAKRTAAARIRHQLAEMLPGCEFLLPTPTEKGALVGIRFGENTVIAEGPTFWEAYHHLTGKTIRSMI